MANYQVRVNIVRSSLKSLLLALSILIRLSKRKADSKLDQKAERANRVAGMRNNVFSSEYSTRI